MERVNLMEITQLIDGQALGRLPDTIVREHVPGLPVAWVTKKGLRIIAGYEPYLGGRYGPLLHVSFSHANRLPGWGEVKLVKDTFYGPQREAMLVLPKAVDYTNIHTTTHHLWEMPEPWTDVGPV